MKSKHTDEQLAWLRAHLGDYENRAGGNVRGDAKKYALEMANKYIEKWGVPDGEKETTMKERQGSEKEASAYEKSVYDPFRIQYLVLKPLPEAERPSTGYLTVPNIEQPTHPTATTPSQLTVRYPPPPTQPPPPPQPQPQPTHYAPPPPPVPTPHYSHQQQQPTTMVLSPYACSVRDSILNPTCDTGDVSTAMQLCPEIPEIINAMFASAVLITTTSTMAAIELGGDPIHHVLHRYSAAINQWPRTMEYKVYSGPLSGRHLLHYAIRKHAMWIPLVPFHHHPHDIQEEIARINLDRQRRRDHVLWARIHAAALELGLMENSWLAETLANDAMWEDDEVEWVSGCVLLKGLVRSGKVPMDSSSLSWGELMHRYQAKWKEVRDEGRQALMAETLLDIRKTLEATHGRI
ncbi:hypothetical protein Clacol_009108 [Clathrus columnatus]|uniref:Uncharacterized protein n=1 Tax=Clathrus columnatus TaxID=1419009 RepID=A0AAV5APU2_9AGAM|nr:hypothetical protein Clacol_009108 [Clathrus columnatus]